MPTPILDEPKRARRALEQAQTALEETGTTGRVVVDGEIVTTELTISSEEIGEKALPIVERLPPNFITEWLADPANPPWHGASDTVLDLTLKRESGTIRMSGSAELSLEHVCVRCLEEVKFMIAMELDLHLVVGLEKGALTGKHAAEHAMPDTVEDDEVLDDTDIVHFDGKNIAVLDVLREQVFLEVPMHPACGGAYSVNEELCSLDQSGALAEEQGRWQDPRWAALAELRDQLPQTEGED